MSADYCPGCGGKLGYLVSAKGAREVGCEDCGRHPGADHPLQLELDAQWAEHDARAAQAAQAGPAPAAPARPRKR